MRSHPRPLPPTWRLVFMPALACLLAPVLLLGTSASAVEAQIELQGTLSPPASPLRDAARALRTGDYDQVDRLTRDLGDVPDAVLLRARAAIARGAHARAAEWLAALAAREPAGDAALELGLLHRLTGRRAEATRVLEPVLRGAESGDAAAVARGARAAHAVGRIEEAHELFREAAALAGDDPDLQTSWGDLLLEKHQGAEAARSYRAAIQASRGHAAAFVGLGRTMVDTNPPVARQLAERALSLNPSLVAAHVFVAEMALDDRDRAAAVASIDRALAVNPSSLEARSLRAAVAWLEDRHADFDAEVAAVLAINPVYGAVYRVSGSHAARHYRFEDAVSLVERGLSIDPSDSRGWAELGLHLMRTGDEARARDALDRAFRDDPYDLVTYNLLGLLDTLDTFVTIEDGLITMRLHPDEAPVLREHALPIARDALQALVARYGFTPRGPILIEIFPRHDDFAVRTLGLPGMIGALGACFGRVVTLDSPRARPPGTFNWQATLWHELAHVMTLQLSRQRVPRWLTEGISVYEEQRARPEWGREMRLRFMEMMNRGEVIPLADLNQGFSDPERISLAYYQSSLVVEHIVDTHGEESLRELLRAYGDGLETDAAIRRALQVEMPVLQERFSASIERTFGAMRAALQPPEDGALAGQGSVQALRELAADHPASYPVQLALGEALHQAGDRAGAIAAFEAAEALVPVAVGDESPLARIAAIAVEAGDLQAAVRALERSLARNDSNVEAARQLVTLLEGPGDEDRRLRAHARVAEMDPFDAPAHSALGAGALASGEYEAAARWFRVALAAGPSDLVSAQCDLAEAYVGLGSRGEAKQLTLDALESAPTYPRAQDLLLAIVDGAP